MCNSSKEQFMKIKYKIYDTINKKFFSRQELEHEINLKLPWKFLNGETKYFKDRYVLNDNIKLLYTIIDAESSQEFECISLNTLGLHLGIKLSKNEMAKISNIKNHKLYSCEIRGRKLILKDADKKKIKKYLESIDPPKSEKKKKFKAYREKNIEKEKARSKLWRKNNKDHIREYNKKYCRKRYRNDPEFRIRLNLRSRINQAIKKSSSKKIFKLEKLIGCTIQELKKHLELKFSKGMSWDNYGKWHIDHILPCASFDLTKKKNQLDCCNYKNLQPLWAEDNIKKGSSINYNT